MSNAHAHPEKGKAEHAAHPPHEKHKPHEHEKGPGTPPWLISFGDMMTLFLCFFIMLVTMAQRQDAGLVAAGLGPLVAILEGGGKALTGDEKLQAINVYRERFGLAPLSHAEQLVPTEVRGPAEIEDLVRNSLRPHYEVQCPVAATFELGSAELSERGKHYLDLIAEALRPGRNQTLVLEGHAPREENGEGWSRLAAARSRAVKAYLVEVHRFIPQRVEARALAVDTASETDDPNRVDCRFLQRITEK